MVAAPPLSCPDAAASAGAGSASPDPAAQQTAMLGRLAEIGMAIAEAAGRAAARLADGDAPGADVSGPALAYARAARAVRLTLALQSRLAQDLAARRRTEAARRRDRIHARAEAAIAAEPMDEDEAEALSAAVWERLTETDDEDELLDLPPAEAVARICRALRLEPRPFLAAFTGTRAAEPDPPPAPPNAAAARPSPMSSSSGLSPSSSGWSPGSTGPPQDRLLS